MNKVKYIISILLLFSISKIQGQNFEFNFFESIEEEKGKYFSYSLIQPKIDSLQTIEKIENYIYEVYESNFIDTLYFENFRILSKKEHYKLISEFADTTHQTIIINEEKERVINEACNNNKEWVTELKPKIQNLKRWIPLNNDKLIYPSNWVLEKHEEFVSTKRYIVMSPCDPRVEITPIEYKTISIVIPTKKLNEKRQQLLNKYTRQYLTYNKQERRTFKRKNKEYLIKKQEYRLSSEAQIKRIEVLSEIEVEKKLPLLIDELIKENYLKEDQRKNLILVKKAMINFQKDNKLPIGQFDLKSIERLLKNKN